MAKRLAIVDKDKCFPTKCGHYWCMGACPVNRQGEECIVEEVVTKKVKIIEDTCIGCGICLKCPFDAIKIINLPDRLQADPLHRYGENQFELFTCPIPKKNMVVGIIGRNGIGKSTALQLLSGQVIPNFGNFKVPGKQDTVIKNFANVTLGEYFQELYAGKIKVSYKPQRVELLPKVLKGTVRELLQKADETNTSESLMKILGIDHLMDRDITQLSGGELQRFAIVAAASKKFDVLYLDEPSSFLDIKQRVEVGKLIRMLAESASVVVVEHDLATLDYVSDEIQVIYGEQSAYGIVSQSKSVKRGINEYLDGYLPDDNVRFREYSIKFSAPLPVRKETDVLFSYPELVKNYPSFSLKVSEGYVNRGEVLAIMGQNGLGKSTFLKMLAGIEQPDNISLIGLKISYKPQYLPMSDLTVEEFLRKEAGQNFNNGWWKQNVLEKLNLKNLLPHKLEKLSGGELQKVHVAACLSKEADIFALDEPSAFIDVEDRLKIAEVIKEFSQKKEVCALVVDHDVQFIDYLADAMLVFEGVPGVSASVVAPTDKRAGMNRVLKMLDITYRQDAETNRPRINKPGSQLDMLQKKKGEYYYR